MMKHLLPLFILALLFAFSSSAFTNVVPQSGAGEGITVKVIESRRSEERRVGKEC